MTTRVLSSRALRLALASVIVGGLVFVFEVTRPPAAVRADTAATTVQSPTPDVEYVPPLWPGQRVVSKDTITLDRLPDGRCYWGSVTMKSPPNGLAATIGERHYKTCRAVVYNITMPPNPPR